MASRAQADTSPMPHRYASGSKHAGGSLHPQGSVGLRLAQVYSVAKARTAFDLYRRSCQRVAQGNKVFRAFGMPGFITDQMAVIDASLASEVIPPLAEAIHLCETADCFEEAHDEIIRHAVETNSLTVEQARAAIKASAAKRHRAEIREKALERWIEKQEK